MKCECDSLPDAFYLDRGPKDFEKKLKNLDAENWMHLSKCPNCGQLWIVDEWDKYSFQIASKTETRSGWEKNENLTLRKELLIKERGGLIDKECVWAGCSGKTVKGVAYCIEHLWKTGARR